MTDRVCNLGFSLIELAPLLPLPILNYPANSTSTACIETDTSSAVDDTDDIAAKCEFATELLRTANVSRLRLNEVGYRKQEEARASSSDCSDFLTALRRLVPDVYGAAPDLSGGRPIHFLPNHFIAYKRSPNVLHRRTSLWLNAPPAQSVAQTARSSGTSEPPSKPSSTPRPVSF